MYTAGHDGDEHERLVMETGLEERVPGGGCGREDSHTKLMGMPVISLKGGVYMGQLATLIFRTTFDSAIHCEFFIWVQKLATQDDKY